MRRRFLAGAAAVAAVVTTAVAYGVASATDPSAAHALGPGEVTVEIGIEHSRFSVSELEVRAGTTVRFVVRNTDPIAHELIVGDDRVHRRHASGTEAVHPPVPGEVSVGPHETASTVYAFDEPGTVAFACHLPGHVDYGMDGEVVVVR